jgi:hypothetical protein
LPGYYRDVGTAGCSGCDAGKYTATYNAASCESCVTGQHAGIGSAACTDCRVGKFHASTGATCHSCATGKYNAWRGQGSCVHCPSGKYQDKLAYHECHLCQYGMWTSGLLQQSECVAVPTAFPTAVPSPFPTASPSPSPTAPTRSPTAPPTASPTLAPSELCGAGQWRNVSRAVLPCQPCRSCDTSVSFYAVTCRSGGDAFNAICAGLRQCAASEFESLAPTEFADRECSPATVCADSEFEATPATTSSDRACQTFTTCLLGSEFETVAATPTSDRKCQAIGSAACTAGEYQTAPPTATSDRQCAPLTACNASAEYETAAPSLFSDRACAALTQCLTGECEMRPAGGTSDRVCAVKVVSAQCESVASKCACRPTPLEEGAPALRVRRLLDEQYWNSCPAGTFQSTGDLFDAASQPECQTALAECPPGTLTLQLANATHDMVCQAWATCLPDSFVALNGSATADPQCSAFSECSLLTHFVSKQPTGVSDRECTALATCAAGTQYESNYGDRGEADDRQCTSFAPGCAASAYRSASAVTYGPLASGPVCTAYTVCDAELVETQWSLACPRDRPKQFTLTAATATADRVCENTSPDCGAERFMTQAWTAASDLQCAAATASCQAPTHEHAALTQCSDRECATHSPTPAPSPAPTESPSASPVAQPTPSPTKAPTAAPTTACPPGTYSNGGGCSWCDAGTFTGAYNSAS